MIVQTEKPMFSLDELESALGQRPIYASGGQIENFRRGWGHDIMARSEAAHYYRRNGFDGVIGLCGRLAQVRWVYGAGNYPHCRACQRTADKKGIK